MPDPQPPRSTANPSPPRRPGSIRRTTSIDVTWTDGSVGPRRFEGRARDVLKPLSGPDRIRVEASMTAIVDFDRRITALASEPSPPSLASLVGERGGGHLRGVLRERLPELIEAAHPLYLLLDDISGTSLVSNWGWSQWNADWAEQMRADAGVSLQDMMDERKDVCWGFREGSTALDASKHFHREEAADGKDLRNPDDPAGWHDFPPSEGVSFRRARRIDLWREADRVGIEASFQDSAPRPGGGRAALHEYVIRASLDPDTLELTRLDPEGRVLPFHECPGAIPGARALVGTPLGEIRQAVLGRLRGPQGCTHLNDALRALAEVPALLTELDEALAPAG